MKLSFSGKHVLILGGSSELGLQLARQALGSGLQPLLTYRSTEGRQRIKAALGDAIVGLPLDLNDGDSVQRFLEQLPVVDLVADLFHSDYESYIAAAEKTAVFSYFQSQVAERQRILQALSRQLLAGRRGRLVYVSSTAAGAPQPGQGFYASGKLAVEALYKNLGVELAPKGITTAILRPGYIACGRGKRYLQKHANSEKKIPLRRALNTREVAETLLFLLSQSAQAINATVLTMDGGLTAGK